MEGITLETPRKSTRIYIPLKDQKLPVVFSYHQLYKREQKEIESFVPLNNKEDSFYDNLLKRAESYVPSEEDDGSDDDNLPIGKSREEDYDFGDPFIDDSEMLMEEPEDYITPDYGGFFVYQGPLDGNEGTTNTEKKTTNRNSKSNNTKGKSTSSSSSTTKKTDTKSSRSVKKSNEDNKQKKPATTTTTTSSTSKSASTSDQAVSSSSTTTKKSTSTPASESKKPTTTNGNTKKVATKLEKEEPTSSHNSSLVPPSPVRVDLTSDSEVTEKKKSSSSSSALEMEPLDSEIEELINILRRDVKPEMFETKSKFPSQLKPTVFKIGLVIFRKRKTIDDNILSHLMSILPYNRFTLRKLLTTKSGQLRIDELNQEIDELAIQLKRKIDDMIPEQQRAYEERVAQHQKESQAAGETGTIKEEEKKFRCNEEVRMLLYELMKADEQVTTIQNLICGITKKPEGATSEGKARKAMYQRLLSCWPEGWMNSYEMSRQYSQIKSKITPKTGSSTPSSSQGNAKTTPTADRKRKRVTPQSSPDDANRKKSVITSENTLPSPLKINQTPPTIIDLDNDDEPEQPWQPPPSSSSNSMKIEALISGPK